MSIVRNIEITDVFFCKAGRKLNCLFFLSKIIDDCIFAARFWLPIQNTFEFVFGS
jgi:hypothetical protein